MFLRNFYELLLHGVISRKIIFFIVIVMRTSNPSLFRLHFIRILQIQYFIRQKYFN
jgi:hypothetical protein